MAVQDYTHRELDTVSVSVTGPIPLARMPHGVGAEVTFVLARLDGKAGDGPNVRVRLGISAEEDTLANDLAGQALASAQNLLAFLATVPGENVTAAMTRWIEREMALLG